jgi:dihydroorotate dehydrogenase
MDLSVSIAGVRFPSCFMNASGALCVTREELLALGRSRAGAIVTKSMTVEPRDGNPTTPVLWISRRVHQLHGLAESRVQGVRRAHS